MTTARPLSGRTAVVWSAAELFGQQGANFLVQILLARLITPSEFGLVAMLMIFLALGQTLSEAGFPHALIQKPDADQIDKSSVFFCNILISTLLAGLLCAASGSIAEFYEQPRLQKLTCVMSLMIVVQAFGATHNALTRKDLNFKRRTIAAVVASVLSGIIAVVMAYRGMGIWALAAQMILMRLFQSVLLWWAYPWKPSWVFDIGRLRTMFAFGMKLMIASSLNAIFSNIYLLAVGKLYTPTLTGYYSYAKRLQMFPSQSLNTVFCQVAFPLLSRRQHDPKLLRETLKTFIQASTLVIMPLMSSLAGLGEPLFHTVLGVKWLPAVPYFTLLCVIGVLLPLQALNLQYLLATGRSNLFLRLSIIKESTTLINLAASSWFSLMWIIRGQVIVAFICLWINTYYTGVFLAYGGWRQFCDIYRTLIFAMVEFAVCFAWAHYSPWPPWLTLSVGLVGALALWAAFVWTFERWVVGSVRETIGTELSGQASKTS